MVSHKIIPVGAYEVNCVILWNGEDALVLDPGQDAELLLAFLSGRSLRLRAILLTHGHFDHVNGIPGILEKNPGVPVYAHPSDWVMFGHRMNRNAPDYPGVDKPANLHDIRDIVKDFPAFGFPKITVRIPSLIIFPSSAFFRSTLISFKFASVCSVNVSVNPSREICSGSSQAASINAVSRSTESLISFIFLHKLPFN